MKIVQKALLTATLGLSLGGLGLASGSASAMPANGAATITTARDTGGGLPLEHVQYYGGYGYGYPCVFPYRCGYRPGFYGRGVYGGRGYYGRGFYGRGYGRGFRGRRF